MGRLRRYFQDRGLPYAGLDQATLIKKVEEFNENEDVVRPESASGSRKDRLTLNAMCIGLRYDVRQHLVDVIAGNR
jgi:hypothetical protein